MRQLFLEVLDRPLQLLAMPIVSRIFQLTPNTSELHLKRFPFSIHASLLSSYSISRFALDTPRLCRLHLLFNRLTFPSTCHRFTIIHAPEYTTSVTGGPGDRRYQGNLARSQASRNYNIELVQTHQSRNQPRILHLGFCVAEEKLHSVLSPRKVLRNASGNRTGCHRSKAYAINREDFTRYRWSGRHIRNRLIRYVRTDCVLSHDELSVAYRELPGASSPATMGLMFIVVKKSFLTSVREDQRNVFPASHIVRHLHIHLLGADIRDER